MDVFTGSPSADLRMIAGRMAIDRMEQAYKESAAAELQRRAGLDPKALRVVLVRAERYHRKRYTRTGDPNCLRWADQLKTEIALMTRLPSA